MIKPVTFVPDIAIEARAHDLVSRYERRFGALKTPPVPVVAIAEQTLDIEILWDELDNFTLGKLDPRAKIITMNDCLRAYFDRYFSTIEFSIAHEIGHWELHCDQGGTA